MHPDSIYMHTGTCMHIYRYTCICIRSAYNYISAYREVSLKPSDLAPKLSFHAHSLPPFLPLAWGWEGTTCLSLIPSDLRKHTCSSHSHMFNSYLSNAWRWFGYLDDFFPFFFPTSSEYSFPFFFQCCQKDFLKSQA